MRNRMMWIGLFLTGGLLVSGAQADEAVPAAGLTVGQPFPARAVQDQHDKPVSLPGQARVIIYANSKAADEWINPVLADFGATAMKTHQVDYVSDISRMPSFIGRMIALPQLRERNYPVVLLRDEAQIAGMPAPASGCVDWLTLHDGVVKEIVPLCNAAQMQTHLDALP